MIILSTFIQNLINTIILAAFCFAPFAKLHFCAQMSPFLSILRHKYTCKPQESKIYVPLEISILINYENVASKSLYSAENRCLWVYWHWFRISRWVQNWLPLKMFWARARAQGHEKFERERMFSDWARAQPIFLSALKLWLHVCKCSESWEKNWKANVYWHSMH